MIFGLLTVSCAATEPPASIDSTSSASMFVGSFTITSLTVVDSDIDFTGQPTIEIDNVAASISVDTGCNTHLGSYSFFEDGAASVTLTGGTRRACNASNQLQDGSITDVLSRVDSWVSSSQSTITLSTPAGDTIEMKRQ